MAISQKQISLFTEDKSMSSQGDFPANHTHQQVNALEKRMTDTSGQKCLEQLRKFNHVGLWAKTFSALLIGMEDWYSRKCRLTWKLKGTKSNRLFFQLSVSTLPTEETEFGLLLKTPCAADSYSENLSKKEQKMGNSGTLAQEVATGFVEKRGVLLPTPNAAEGYKSTGAENQDSLTKRARYQMLPTPTTQEAETPCELDKNGRRLTKDKKDSHSLNLGRMASMQMLPTPNARDWKGATKPGERVSSTGKKQKYGEMLPDIVKRMQKEMLPTPLKSDTNAARPSENWDGSDLTGYVNKGNTGTLFQLNPLFVEEMMGFPATWTLLPFLNGEESQSKPTETQ